MMDFRSKIPGTSFWVDSDNKFELRKQNIFHRICFDFGQTAVKLTIRLDPNEIDFIIWPNREGEKFNLKNVLPAMKKWDVREMSITYPATASSRFFIFGVKGNKKLILVAPPDFSGRTSKFSLKKNKEHEISLEINALPCQWIMHDFEGAVSQCQEILAQIHKIFSWVLLPPRPISSKFFVQIGLIDPKGKTKIPQEKGFMVLKETAELMEQKLGRGNILHVFGYAQGHDLNYPDYSPSSLLGGEERLKSAISKVHQCGQKIVFYLNARVASKSLVDHTPEFSEAVFLDLTGNAVIENYPNIKGYESAPFYVMDGNNDVWQTVLLNAAKTLRNLGADGVQLDQIGGREALVEPGKNWGGGYLKLITALHKLGLMVWMQGVSDVYHADWGEMVFRHPSVLPNGAIRGGTPLGDVYMNLFFWACPGRMALIPGSKIHYLPEYLNSRCIENVECAPAELFFHDSNYNQRLSVLLQVAVTRSNMNGRTI